MGDSWRVELSTRPSCSTQPAPLGLRRRGKPVESITRSIVDACRLAQLEGRGRVYLTVGVAYARLCSPSLAC